MVFCGILILYFSAPVTDGISGVPRGAGEGSFLWADRLGTLSSDGESVPIFARSAEYCVPERAKFIIP